jgi:polar amino acid transport system permease protein
MQLFLIYFGLPLFLRVNISDWSVACIALIIFTSAFLAEIWSSCIQAVPIAQWESAASLGLGHLQQLRYIIIPQALKIALPPSVGFSAQVIKGTSMTSIIGFIELTRMGQVINNVTFKPFIVYSMVAMIYFLLCYPISIYSKRMEKRLNGTS